MSEQGTDGLYYRLRGGVGGHTLFRIEHGGDVAVQA